MSTPPAAQQQQTQEQRVPVATEKSPVAIAVATAIRHNKLLKQRQGILSTTKSKTEFFRFKRFVRAIQSDDFKQKQSKNSNVIPVIPDDVNSINQIFILLIQNQLVVPVNKLKTQDAKKQGYKVDKTTPAIELYNKAVLQPDVYYAWNFNPPNPYMWIYSILTIIAIFTIILFPLWPLWMRKGVWYLSTGLLGFIGLFFIIAIIRLIIYLITLATMSNQFWLFPNLFADCGVIESFKPLYMWEDGSKNSSNNNKNNKNKKKVRKGKKMLETTTSNADTATKNVNTSKTTTTPTTNLTTSVKPSETASKKRIVTIENVEE
jgi:translocation protein SEC62